MLLGIPAGERDSERERNRPELRHIIGLKATTLTFLLETSAAWLVLLSPLTVDWFPIPPHVRHLDELNTR